MKYICNFPRILKWNETTKENYWCYIHSIWMRHMDFRMGVRNWKTKTPKVENKQTKTNNKSNTKKTPLPTFQTSDYFFLIRAPQHTQFSYQHYISSPIALNPLISNICILHVGKKVKWEGMSPILKSHILGLICDFFSSMTSVGTILKKNQIKCSFFYSGQEPMSFLHINSTMRNKMATT